MRLPARRRRGAVALLVLIVAAASSVAVLVVNRDRAQIEMLAGLSPSGPAPSGAARPPCPTGDSAATEFLDVVHVGNREFVRNESVPHTAPPVVRLGATVEVVRCTYSAGNAPRPGYAAQSGDASYLPVGTPVREVVGLEEFRVAAEIDGQLALYDVTVPTAARTADEVFPGVRDNVIALALADQENGRTELARIDEPTRVAALVEEFFAAPQRPEEWKRVVPTWDVFLDLQLDDGTRVQRAYDSRRGVLEPGIVVPDGFREELRRALP